MVLYNKCSIHWLLDVAILYHEKHVSALQTRSYRSFHRRNGWMAVLVLHWMQQWSLPYFFKSTYQRALWRLDGWLGV